MEPTEEKTPIDWDKKDEWWISSNEEIWNQLGNITTREAYLEARAQAEEGLPMQIAVFEGREQLPREFPIDWEAVDESLGDLYGEDDQFCESNEKHLPELEAAIHKVWCDWIDKHGIEGWVLRAKDGYMTVEYDSPDPA